MTPLYAFFPAPGPMELLVILGLAVLLFGKKLPEVGRYVGKSIVEFKKGIKGLEDDVESGGARQEPVLEPPRPPQRVQATAPKFEDKPDDSPASPNV